ncbi:MAG: ATP-dependent deoxyribonuclease subunit [Pedosphaera sp.]|nr:ATP-dependent deoxyribonuclease subunit [Pedosphaera sp.]
MSLTPAQQEAIVARGNVLVVAGAGTGKTSTLVARCLHCLLEEKPPASLDEILMVTFTEAAAAEMRRRIRELLERELAAHSDDLRWSEQLALFDTAHIGTLHSFCLQLVRQHFYELELDPQLTVLPEEEAKLLADETLETALQAHYAGRTDEAEAVQQLIQTQGRGWDLPIRTLVLKLHHYTQTLRDPAGWFTSQLATCNAPEPTQWRLWLAEGVSDWRHRWLPALQIISPENLKASACATLLKNLPAQPSPKACAALLDQIQLADQDWLRGKKTAWRKSIEGFFDEAAFFHSLTRTSKTSDPLNEDWAWVRPQLTTLLRLAQEFTAAFSDAKRELGVVDFHDLEQHALKLLWDRTTKQPTATARQWREKLRFVFVDEYQDINDAQDAILKALSREGDAANRFLVGDVKQSIYRFRLADPHIFQHYVETWRGNEGRAIPLVDNFRSREVILQFINSLFASLMRCEIGSVPYDTDAQLRFGDPANRHALSLAGDAAPRVELHVRLKSSANDDTPAEPGEATQAWTEMMNLEEAEKEARLIALRLRELKAESHLIWDESTREMRPVQWSDMAVLLRSPSGKAESYAKEFTRLGVPLLVARGGFYENMEVTDLLSLLQLLDNPLQDLPVLAVLHSPLVGLSLDELASVRQLLPKGNFWAALQRYHEADPGHPAWTKAGWAKTDRFLKNFASWRRLARQVSLSRCLEAVLSQTHYAAWLLTQPRGEQRHANVQRLLLLARQFDRFQRQGLFRFLRFIEAQQAAETEPEMAALSAENSVSLMSIHQSKGLEFPVVVVADMGKQFNLADLRAELILDEKYGLCPQIKPPQTGQRYPSLPYWLARQRQKQEMLGEESRLLYVAMTRARDTLILTGAVSAAQFGKQWQETSDLTTARLLTARNYLDWLAAWSTQSTATLLAPPSGANVLLRWKIYEDDRHLLSEQSGAMLAPESAEPSAPFDAPAWQKLQSRLSWQYPHLAATQQPAKTSVSTLRRQWADETAAETKPLFKFKAHKEPATAPAKLSATEIGTAHHTFLQLVSLERTGSLAELKQEAMHLERHHALSAEEIATLDFPALAEFWQSDLGQKIRSKSALVRRELPFTVRFRPEELLNPTTKIPHLLTPELFDDEFVVVQGVADLLVLLPDKIWLVDFKTDAVTPANLAEKVAQYQPQLQLYAFALSRIYHRPVSELHLHFLAARRSVSLPVPQHEVLEH